MDIPLRFEKLSRFDRDAEPCSVAIPFREGELAYLSPCSVLDGDRAVPTQLRATATWPDGSVKWLLAHFLADLPGNQAKAFVFSDTAGNTPPPKPRAAAAVSPDGRARVMTGTLELRLPGPGRELLQGVSGPWLRDDESRTYRAMVAEPGWREVEAGPVRCVLQATGKHVTEDGQTLLDFSARLYAYAGKPWVQLTYRFVNREAGEEVVLQEIALEHRPALAEPDDSRTAVASSNYRSSIQHNDQGGSLRKLIDHDFLIYESNEQVAETNYGTFWGSLCNPACHTNCSITIHQAQQNFPKAIEVDGERTRISLWPEDAGPLRLVRGVAKTHRMLLHFHGNERPELSEINVRSLQYQMPDRPVLPPGVYRRAGVLEDVHVENPLPEAEAFLTDLADVRTRAYGMLNWGDGPDAGYTNQGRGHGELVWTNNEYDLPHAALLMFARTGERRFEDYLRVAAEHWMDVDVCHFSEHPLRHRGQIAHSARHVTGGVTVSHEWVEGLLDYYHLTGEEVALHTAIGIGENVLLHLDRPELRTAAGSAARETGWALRTLVALYLETHSNRWMRPAEFIVQQFRDWQAEYGAWLAPYTDHTLARVPFMIAVAVNSLMRYWRVRPSVEVGDMIVDAVRDLIDNCLMPDGRFYYKELPSLQRRGAGPLVIEALANAYEICGDVPLLEAGMPTFYSLLAGAWRAGGYEGAKFAAGDAVVCPGGPGPKAFAALLPPALAFYVQASRAGLLRPTWQHPPREVHE